MQNIIIQNTNKRRNGEDITVKELREMTLGELTDKQIYDRTSTQETFSDL